MKQAQSEGCLFREQPFVIEVLASDVLKTETGEETMLVQGIIDAFFEENGKIVLLDYKTDYVEQRDGSDLVGKVWNPVEILSESTGADVGKAGGRKIYLFRKFGAGICGRVKKVA